MMKGRFNYPDLDILDSPLMTSAPFTATFSNIPGSAIAERIFNDPESWGDDDDDKSDFPEDVDGEQIAWLAEDLEKVRVKAAGLEQDSKASLIATPASALPPRLLKRDPSIAWKGMGLGKRGAVRPISLAALFEHTTEDFSGEMQQQLSKILESGGIPHHLRFPHSSALSPPSTSGSSTLDTPLHIQTTAGTGNGGDMSPSPVTIYSASATLSFLEWHGIHPDSPRLDLNAIRAMQPKSARLKAPTLHIPSPRRPSRPASMLETPLAETPVARQAKRSSSVPPPGLDVPADVQPETRPATPPAPTRAPTPPQQTRSPSPVRAQPRPQPAKAAAETLTVRPAHTRAASASKERGRSLVTPAPPPPPQTLQRSDSAPSRRKLPSIPPSESASSSRSSTPPVQSQAPQPHPLPRPRACSRNATPPPPTASLTLSAAVQSPHLQHAQLGPRPISAVRSPQSGPAGPRTRGRGSRDSAGTPSIASAMAHRPAGLRL